MTSLDELKTQIELLPQQLRDALERKARANLGVTRLEEEVDKLKAQIKADDEEEEPEDEDEDNNVELIKLEAKQERLKVKLGEAEDKAELQFRRETPKATDSYVKAAVGNDSQVNRLRLEIIDVKEEARIKKITIQRERRATWEARVHTRRASMHKAEPESKELNSLQEQLYNALEEMMLADAEVESLRAKLDSYKMLVQLKQM